MSNFNEAKKKKPCSSITHTTGDPWENIKHFNKEKYIGTDPANPSTEEAKAQRAADAAAKSVGTFASQSPDGGSSISSGDAGCSGGDCGGMAEAFLAEKRGYKKHVKHKFKQKNAKRYVRRYYIRPQNVFCSNKADLLHALIQYEDENCSVYTLNNLGDEKDVTKLSNKDIIYYYDDGILYDKNRVKVMDYDLYIKHEEERPKLGAQVSDETLADVYTDRLTGNMTDDDITEAFEDDPLNLTFEDVNAYGEKLVEGKVVDNICCICGERYTGYGNNAEPYTHGNCCDACNLKFVIPARLELMQAEED